MTAQTYLGPTASPQRLMGSTCFRIKSKENKCNLQIFGGRCGIGLKMLMLKKMGECAKTGLAY